MVVFNHINAYCNEFLSKSPVGIEPFEGDINRINNVKLKEIIGMMWLNLL